MIRKFFIENKKYLFVHVFTDYSCVRRFSISEKVFLDLVQTCLNCGFGVEHRVISSNEFSNVEKDIFYLQEDKMCCIEFMYEKKFI